MTTLLATCRACPQTPPAAESKDGLCLECQADAACADHRREYGRLWLKWQRYDRQHHSVTHIEVQMRRVALQRMRPVVGNLIHQPERAEECWRSQLRRAVVAVDPGAPLRAGTRIVTPAHGGDVLAAAAR
ncbi:MAG: hypothetical protein ACRDNS_30350 [Trebonia sp.]